MLIYIFWNNSGFKTSIKNRADIKGELQEYLLDLVDYVSSIHAGGASALSTSPELFNRVKDLLSTEYYTGKDISRFTPEQTFEALMHFMAKGNAVANQKAVDFCLS